MAHFVPSDLQAKNRIFTDRHAARMALERLRWPDGPICPKTSCGASGPVVAKMGGVKQSHREGLYRCKACRGQFTVTVGTVFERSKVPLQDWLKAVQMLSAVQPVTIRQIEIELGITYKTAFQIWKRVSGVLRAYRGHNKGFGKKIEAYITSQRPNPDGMSVWRKKSKLLLNGGNGVPNVTGLLSLPAPEGSENLDRTERLLRLLIAATPKLSKSAKRKAARRAAAN
jgi:transposase-like protein